MHYYTHYEHTTTSNNHDNHVWPNFSATPFCASKREALPSECKCTGWCAYNDEILNDVFLRIFLSLNNEWFFYNLDGSSYRNIQFWESKSVCWLTQFLERASFLDYILLTYEEEREIVLVPALFCKDLNLTHKRSHLNDLIIFQSPSCKFHHIEIWVSTYELGENLWTGL